MNATWGVTLAVTAGYGVFLMYTALALGWSGLGVSPGLSGGTAGRRGRVRAWMTRAGLGDVRPGELVAFMGGCAVVGAGLSYALFGGALAPAATAVLATAVPVAAARTRRLRRQAQAREAWPRLIEGIRLQTTTLGRSIPRALFAVGRDAPEELRPAFAAAEREWLLSTDFARTLALLRARLADATADAVCEPGRVALVGGGSDIDQRLSALIEDRVADLEGRKDAEAKQAGARFARWFVLAVPLGMALAGLTIGSGRAAYATSAGQFLVVAALGMIALCWLWAGRIMRLPAEQRVFDGAGP